MKKIITLVAIIIYLTLNQTYAHPGNVDSFSGHTCYTNCIEYGLYEGQYHFHPFNGYGYDTTIYLDTSSYCPNDFDVKDYKLKNEKLEKIEARIQNNYRNEEREFANSAKTPAYVRIQINDMKSYDEIERSSLISELSILDKENYACEKKEKEEEYWRLEEINSYMDKGGLYVDNGFLLEGINEYKKILQLELSNEEKEAINDMIGYLYYEIGIEKLNEGNNNESISNLEESLKYINFVEIRYDSYVRIGENYKALNEYKSAINFYRKAKEYALRSGNSEISSSSEIIKINKQIEELEGVREQSEQSTNSVPNISLKDKYKSEFKSKLGDKLSNISTSRLKKLKKQISILLKSSSLDVDIRAKLEALDEILEEILQ